MERMKRTFAVALLFMLGAVIAAPASPVTVYDFSVGNRHVLGDPIAIRLTNPGKTTVTMGKTWDLNWLDGDGSAFYQWPDEEVELEPGESRVWTWDQRINACYGECQNVREGDPAEPGRYAVTTTFDAMSITIRFSIGQYFTLGFDQREKIEFAVFVAEQPQIDQMTDQAHADEKTLITSGVVRKGGRYNPDWNFTMGPYSIALGEVFMEVCDGSPWYVQKHRKEWLGERWCPWGSYVKRVGR